MGRNLNLKTLDPDPQSKQFLIRIATRNNEGGGVFCIVFPVCPVA